MSIKKCVNGSFVNDYYREYGTETDTITTLPKSIIADGQSASANIIGNMQQTGTPSPSSIIMPSETGDKTANLFDKDNVINNKRIDAKGQPFYSEGCALSLFIPVSANTAYTLNNIFNYDNCLAEYDANKNFIIRYVSGNGTITTTSNTAYIRVATLKTSLNTRMFTKGSTSPSSYIPYGFQIPILSGGTTTPVYLGEVQSERKTGQKILKGDENITYNAVGGHSRFNILGLYATSNYQIGYCSHYNYQYANQNYNVYHSSNNSDTNIYIFDDNYTSADDFKTYLQQQYANGTPVTVWYVLATPTTGIVNEPIRKIDTYADSVSVTGIPTTGTAENFDIGTTLKPSEVDLTYHGWHEHPDTKF